MNLAYAMRPETLDEFLGQQELVGPDKLIRRLIQSDNLPSLIFWGPPGVGKTTLAYIISRETKADFHPLSAVAAGKADLLKIIDSATENKENNRKTILFIDEIHRWNKAQQDVLLPHVEKGLVTLIGATTENPSFEVIGPLLSRCRVFVLKEHTSEDLEILIDRALKNKEKGLGKFGKKIAAPERELLIRLSGGDARVLLNALEIAANSYQEKTITREMLEEIFQNRSGRLYDKKGEEHYNTISAFIKSMRASNVDAALYYLARMVDAGEDPKFIARRMVIFASEDIGQAQPTALVVANAVFRAVEIIGYPECAINLAHGVVYLATAKKDRASYDALQVAMAAVKEYGDLPIPLSIRNAPTKLMKELNYGKGYEMYTDKDLLPEKLKGKKFFK